MRARPSGVTPMPLSCAALIAAAWLGAAQNPPAQTTPATSPQSNTPQVNAPPQFPPLGHGLAPADVTTLQADVDRLAAAVAALKRQHRGGALADRIADVEVYLDAVRRPLKYDERLYAGRGSTPLATAQQTLATGADRAAK